MRLSEVKIHPVFGDPQTLREVLYSPEVNPPFSQVWWGPNGFEVAYHDDGDYWTWGPSSLPTRLQESSDMVEDVVAGIAPILERPELAWTCSTCKAQVGQPCDKKGNVRVGGPSHLTRADKFGRWTRRAER